MILIEIFLWFLGAGLLCLAISLVSVTLFNFIINNPIILIALICAAIYSRLKSF